MLAVAFLVLATSYAYDAKTESYSNMIGKNFETAVVEDFTPPIFVLYSSYLAISGESIQSSGISWEQPSDCNSYRVWVQNDTNETMTVTIRYSTGWWSESTHTITVSANSDKSLTVNNASKGTHRISYTTASGYLSGSVSVRVFDEDL